VAETEVELTIVGDLTVLRLRPRDVLVLRLTRGASVESLEVLRRALKERFPDNESVVLSGGATFDVIRPEEMASDA
jgi:hypothetical protein